LTRAQANAVISSSHAPEYVAVERGLAEFRAGRAVLFAAENAALAIPVDGPDARQLQLFEQVWAARPPWLTLTRRRAHALGIEADHPVALYLNGSENLDTVLSLALDPGPKHRFNCISAGPAAGAAIALAKLAGRLPALLMADVELTKVAGAEVPVIVETETVAGFRRYLAESLRIVASSVVPFEGGAVGRVVVFRDTIGSSPTAIIIGEPDLSTPVLVRLHSACLTGDVFGSRRCDCGDQLKLAMSRMSEVGGIILYLEQEGRGLGLANKMRAYKLQDLGLDTVDANLTLGFEDDERDYQVGAKMLQLLGCHEIVLLTNNPTKLEALSQAGINICATRSLEAPIRPENRRYLLTMARRAGHRLDHLSST
jgi:GTP cyclohydrolase II